MLIRLGVPIKVARLGTIATYSFGRSPMGEGGSIPEHEPTYDCEYAKSGNCYYCCERCNYDNHRCHFCGDDLDHNERDFSGEPHACYDFEEQDEFVMLLRDNGVI